MHPDKTKLYAVLALSFLFLNIALGDVEKPVKNKDPKKAFHFSLVPGLGQVYNGKWFKSAMIIGIEISAYIAWKDNRDKYNNYDSNKPNQLQEHRYLEKRNKYAWWIGIIYVYAMIDAVVDAHLNSFNSLMDSPLDQKQTEGETYE